MRVHSFYRRLPLFALLGAALAAAGCQSLQRSDSLVGTLTPYRVEVVQGNVVTREQAAAVRPGMTRAQVRDVLGSPLLTDPFHDNRWDYVFTIRRPGTDAQLRRVIVLFDGDLLKSVSGAEELPWEREFVASIDTFKTSRDGPPLALTDEQIKALPMPARPAPVIPPAIGSDRSYPPLEPR